MSLEQCVMEVASALTSTRPVFLLQLILGDDALEFWLVVIVRRSEWAL